MPRGNRARVRRTQRRAAAAGRSTALSGKGVSKARNTQADLTENEDELLAAFSALTEEFGAQGGSFDLGARDEAWDGGAAQKGYTLPADSDCYMWAESGGDKSKKSTFKLPFVSKTGGKHAVWKAITAIAALLQGGRGGVSIPDADKAGIKTKVEGYYAKARTKYGDDTIQVPWKGKGAAAEADSEQDWSKLAALADEGRTAAQKIHAALTAAGITDESPIQTVYDMTRGSMAERAYYGAVITAGLDAQAFASWPCDLELEDHGTVLSASDAERTFQLEDGPVVHASVGGGWLYLRAAAESREQAAAVINDFRETYPPVYRQMPEADHTVVPITFWTDGAYGPTSRLRMIDAATWEDISGNYTAAVREELDRLTGEFEPGKDGQLLLWQGPPGTGKTWALRALASEWRDWAEFSYITDPDAFFVHNPSYMIDVLLHDSYELFSPDGDVVTEGQAPESKWRVLILEDTGELLSANAKQEQGQGLSRLLNVVDGMVGQGLRVLVVVTTNDELGDLHPAAIRPGRCASQVEFGPLTPEEASLWLSERQEGDFDLQAPHTLAELYAGLSEAQDAFTDDSGGEAEQRTAMTGTCSCGDAASAHEGQYNDGACSACDCQGFEAQSEADADSEAAILPGDLHPGWFRLTTETPHIPYINAVGVSNVITLDLQGFRLVGQNGVLDVQQPDALFQTLFDPPVITPPQLPVGGDIVWEAVLCPEGRPTDDDRVFAPGAITWRELPLTLMGLIETGEGHDGAIVAGRIDRIWRDAEAGLIRASGIFDSGEFGAEIARLVADGTLRGVSVDLAVDKVEVLPRDQVVGTDGNWIGPVAGAAQEEQEEGVTLLDVLLDPSPDMLYVILSAVIGAATVCPFQAFREATIEVADSLVASVQSPLLWTVTSDAGFRLAAARSAEPADGVGSLTASAAGIAPTAPPADWFADPELEELTALTVTEDGRVYGHAAAWDTCHLGIPGVCTTAPSSPSGYAYFHLKEVLCDDGERVTVGTVTMETGHADRDLNRSDATRHYDDTGTAVVDVRVGEDDFGIWVAGALRGDVDADEARKLRGATLSGDWRSVNGDLELVALLAVNVPGFPVPRARAALVASADGTHVLTLQSAGIHDGTAPAPALSELEAARFAGLYALARATTPELEGLVTP